MIQRGSSSLGCVFPVSPFWRFSEPFLSGFLVAVSRPFYLGSGAGVCLNPSWFFSLWFPSQIREQRGSILGFLLSRVRGVLGGISSIPLDLASFGGPNLGYGVPMRYSYYPQSLVQIRWVIGRSGVGFGNVDPRAVHPDSSGHTGLTSASHWSDRCRPLVEFCSGECLGEFPIVSCCCCFEFGRFLELGRSVWWIWDFLAWTGLTGELHRPDWCRGLLWKFSDFARLLQQGLVWPVLLTSAVQWCSSCLFRCVLE
jgi:hypothetical protein